MRSSRFSSSGSLVDPVRLAIFFGAGFLSVLVFHQGMLALLHAVGIAANPPFPTQPVWPLGAPRILSLAFWGGVWGLIFSVLEPRIPRGTLYLWVALLFGALGPTLVAWFVVSPLRGLPMGGGWQPAGVATGLLVNGAWGIGTALLVRAWSRLAA